MSYQTPTNPPNHRVLNEQELAAYWGLSVKTLQRWRCMSLGPTYLKLGNRVGYRMEDIRQYERDVQLHGSGDPVNSQGGRHA